MSRWLDLARIETPVRHFDKFDKSQPEGCVGSVSGAGCNQRAEICRKSRSVEGGQRKLDNNRSALKLAYSSEDDDLAFAAIVEGYKTYGAVATTTRMGATRAFQATERLKASGRIRQANDGSLSIAKRSSVEGRQ